MTGANRISALPCGRWTKWIVLVFWLLVFVGLGQMATKLTGAQENDASAWLPKNAESTQTLELIEDHKFSNTEIYPALIVYDRDGDRLSAADQAKATADAQRFRTAKDVSKVTGPVPAKDGQALLTIVDIKVGTAGWDKLPPVVDDLREIADQNAAGLRAQATGPAGYAADFSEVFQGFDSVLLYVTAAIVILILLVTYRSPLLWIMPLLCVFISLTAAQAVIYLLAEHAGLTVNANSAFILTVLVFGAGTDYALLLIARYREELRRHEDRHQAMAIALHRAGPAIAASGATVILSMLCLLVSELNSTKSLGPVMAIGVSVALFAMLTLLPAVLVIMGRWIFWPKRPSYGSAEPTESGLWARIGGRVALRPRRTWILTAVALAVMAVGLTSLNTQTIANKDSFTTSKPESVTGEEVMGAHFPAGSGNPILVVGSASAKQQLVAAVSSVPGITGVTTPYPDRDGFTYIEGTLTARPDSKAAYTTLERARDAAHAVSGANAKVGGGTAFNYDINKATARDSRIVIPLVLAMVFLILSALLRALLAPLLLVGTVVLSFGAALGVSALVFDYIFGFVGTDVSFPLWVFVFLVALGVDYNIFLMTRVHEEAKQHGTRRGALVGLAATGGVITSAGAVLAGTFAALGSLPLVFVAELGFAIAFGVLLDTFIVRSVLVTALTLDIGPRIWWPSKLAHDTTTAPKEDEPAPATR